MYLKLGRLRLHITFPFALFTVLAVNYEAGERLAVLFAGALLHECIHLVFLLTYGCGNICLTLHPGGASIRCTGTELLDLRRKLTVCLSAPVLNILIGGILYAAAKKLGSVRLTDAAVINLSLGLVNLLPLSFLDGGRALGAVLEAGAPERNITPILSCCETVCCIGLTLTTALLFLMRIKAAGCAIFTGYCLTFILIKELKKRKINGMIK